MKQEQILTIETFNISADRYEATIAQLQNYNQTYDFLLGLILPKQTVLDLACGPANISKYLIERKELNIIGYDLSEEMLKIAACNIPDGKFFNSSILNLSIQYKVEVVVIGFGLPYLDENQAMTCLSKTYEVLEDNGILYLSFMEGNSSKLEIPSFCPNGKILIHYHNKEFIMRSLIDIGFKIAKEWEIDYKEADGSITKDIILIAVKSHST